MYMYIHHIYVHVDIPYTCTYIHTNLCGQDDMLLENMVLKIHQKCF